MTKLWFKRKRYGWGWTPSTWEGWLVLAGFFVLIIWNFRRIDAVQHSGSDTLINFVPQTFILLLVLLIVCYCKGEKPRWQWGQSENEERNH